MKMRILHQAVILITIVLVIPVSLLSCGGSSGSSNGPVTLTFWVRASDSDFTTPLVKQYNATHKTQIKLSVIPNAQFVTKFGTSVAGGLAPDVMAIDLIYLPAFNAVNEMTDITDKVNQLPFKDKLIPSHMRLASYNGRQYGVPYSADTSALLYNKNLFRQAGLDPNKPPTTWAEIEADSKKITALGNRIYGFYFSGSCAGCNIFTFTPYIWASGGDVLSADGKTATWTTSSPVKDALTFYRRLWTEGQIPPGAKVDDGANFLNAFTTGKIGMTGSGTFAIATLKNQFPKLDFGIAPLPGENGGTSSFAGGDVFGIPHGSKHPNEAWDFISWCLSDQVQVNILAQHNELPVRTDLANNQYTAKDPRYLTLSKALAQGRTPYSTHFNQLFNDQNGPWLAALEKAIFDGKIDEAITTAQQRFTQIINSPVS